MAEEVNSQRKEEPERVGNNAAAEFLQEIKGKEVIVKLVSGVEYHGNLVAIDGFMNISLLNTKEVYRGKVAADYGDVFLRGSLVTYLGVV